MKDRSVDRADLLARFADAPDRVEAQVRSVPSEARSFRPDSDSWTIHEVTLHLADNEAVDFVRVRMAIAESGSEIHRYDEASWVRELDYANEDIDEALRTFRTLRSRTHRLLARLAEQAWERVLVRPEGGQRSVEEKVRGDIEHVERHLQQMRDLEAAWRSSH